LSCLGASTLPSQYTELLNYAVAAPAQGKADSCLYMATTGAVEILANKYFGIKNPAVNSRYDLSERYAYSGSVSEDKSWMENPVLKFNNGGIRSEDLPYNSRYFWRGGNSNASKVKLPQFSTYWFLKSEEGHRDGRFSYDVFSQEDFLKIKRMLVQYRSPIVLIHRTAGRNRSYGYWNTWHTLVVIGYDDHAVLDEKCPLIKETIAHIGGTARKKIQEAVDRQGGCRSQGAFYIRDSEDPLPGESRVPRFVKKSYDDMKILGNNAMMVYIPELLGGNGLVE
jgi:hypothetical protein